MSPRARGRILIANSLPKSLASTGMRVDCLIGRKRVISAVRALKSDTAAPQLKACEWHKRKHKALDKSAPLELPVSDQAKLLV